jgi:serralysin
MDPQGKLFYSSFAVSPDYVITLTPEQPSTYSRATNDDITGSAVIDTVTFSGAFDQYVRTGSLDSLVSQDLVARRDATDELVGVERLVYTDVALALDTQGDAGLACSLYGVFDRAPDLTGIGFWIAALDAGVSADVVAQDFIDSAEFVADYGASLTDEQYVEDLYQSFLDRAPDAQGFEFWVSNLQAGTVDFAGVLLGFATSSEYQGMIAGEIANGIQYDVWQ